MQVLPEYQAFRSGVGGGGDGGRRKGREKPDTSALIQAFHPRAYMIRVNKNCGQSKSLSVRPSVNMSTRAAVFRLQNET